VEDLISITSSSDSKRVCSSFFFIFFFAIFFAGKTFSSFSEGTFAFEGLAPFLILFNDSSTFLGSLFSVKEFILLEEVARLIETFFY